MAAQMLKTLKGKVLDDLSAAHKEALKQAPKPTSQAAAGEDGRDPCQKVWPPRRPQTVDHALYRVRTPADRWWLAFAGS